MPAPRSCRWIAILAASLLACVTAAAEGSGAEQAARDATLALLQRARDDESGRAGYLKDARARIQQGLARSRADPLQHGQWLRAQWYYYMLNDDHARARDILEQARRELGRARADPILIAGVSNDLAYSRILLGEVAKAKHDLRRAIVLMNGQPNHPQLADLYYNLADAYRKTGERMVSRRYFEAAFAIDRAAGDATQASISKLKLGSLERDAGNHREAVRLHQAALQHFRRVPSYWQLVTQLELARDHAHAGALELAEQYARTALADQRALPEHRMDARILLLRIANDRRTRSLQKPATGEATELVVRIAALIDGSSSRQGSQLVHPTRQLQFAEQAIRHYALNQDLGKVAAHGRAAIRLARRVANDLRASYDDSLAWLTEAQPALNAYVKALYELDRAQVFGLLESYYSQAGATAIPRSGSIGRAFEAEAIEQFERYLATERTLVDAAAELQKHAMRGDSAKAHAARQRLEHEHRARDRARDAYLTAYTPEARAPQRAFEELDLPGLELQPKNNDMLIRYFVQEDVSFGVALAAGQLEYFDLPPRSAVLRLIEHASASLDTLGDDDAAPLTALAQLLPLQFISRHPQVKRLVIVPDDAMQLVPFAAIELTGSPSQPLIERYEIIRTKSATGYYAPRRSAHAAFAGATAEIVVFADPITGPAPAARAVLRRPVKRDWNSQLPRLPSSRLEAESIARTYAGRVTSYVGRDATSVALLTPIARGAKVLHIATHGYFSKTTPDIVGLATSAVQTRGAAQPGFISLTQLFLQPYASRLVVISGCETMRGRDYNGWGVRSLADGFITRGAGSVIGTLWSVSDDATAVLMDIFYRELKAGGGNSSQALREAQRELRKLPGFKDPYFWAGITLQSVHHEFDARAL